MQDKHSTFHKKQKQNLHHFSANGRMMITKKEWQKNELRTSLKYNTENYLQNLKNTSRKSMFQYFYSLFIFQMTDAPFMPLYQTFH